MASKAKSLEAQRKELEAKLAEIQRQEEEIVEQKKRVIAQVVWDKMQSDNEYSANIMAMLEAKLNKNADRALFELPKKERKPKPVTTTI